MHVHEPPCFTNFKACCRNSQTCAVDLLKHFATKFVVTLKHAIPSFGPNKHLMLPSQEFFQVQVRSNSHACNMLMKHKVCAASACGIASHDLSTILPVSNVAFLTSHVSTASSGGPTCPSPGGVSPGCAAFAPVLG